MGMTLTLFYSKGLPFYYTEFYSIVFLYSFSIHLEILLDMGSRYEDMNFTVSMSEVLAICSAAWPSWLCQLLLNFTQNFKRIFWARTSAQSSPFHRSWGLYHKYWLWLLCYSNPERVSMSDWKFPTWGRTQTCIILDAAASHNPLRHRLSRPW